MPRSSDRGQTEPLAALVAVIVVCLTLGQYVGILTVVLPGSPDRMVAETAIERVEHVVAPYGVALPWKIDDGQLAGPTGYETNVTLVVGDKQWSSGPPAPPYEQPATVRIGVRIGPSTIKPGILKVRVWT